MSRHATLGRMARRGVLRALDEIADARRRGDLEFALASMALLWICGAVIVSILVSIGMVFVTLVLSGEWLWLGVLASLLLSVVAVWWMTDPEREW